MTRLPRLRELAEFPDYFASNTGHIYSHKSGKWKRLRATPNKRGLLLVSLYIKGRYCYNAARRRMVNMPVVTYVHRLVASVWLPPQPSPQHEIDHKDEDHGNNRPKNLRWVTKQQNTAAFFAKHPDHMRGENNTTSKLTDKAVRAIRAAHGVESSYTVGRRFGVASSTIRRVWQRQSWRHVA